MTEKMLLTAAWRFHRRHPLQLLLSIAGIALGVAVFVGVDVANTSANAAFEASESFVRGAATHRLLPLTDSLDENIFAEQIAPSGIDGAPIIEVPVAVVGTQSRVSLLGVDPVAEAAFRDATRLGMLGGVAPEALITVPLTAVVTAGVIADPAAESINIRTNTGEYTLQIVGRLPPDSGVTNVIVVDIATAQEITGMLGRLSRIDLILDSRQADDLQSATPRETTLVTAGSEDRNFQQLSNAFRINILALGLLALAVGMFLVYSSANFSLLRRSRNFAILRTLGTNKRELTFGIIIEFLALGTVASLLGVLLGHALAGMLVEMMLFTVNDFAFRNEVAVGDASTWLYVKGTVIGIAATLLASIGPISNAVQRNTSAALRRSVLEKTTQRYSAIGIGAALVLLLAGFILLLLPVDGLFIAFTGLFAVLAAAACATPGLAALGVSLLSRVFRLLPGFITLQAARNVLAQQSRIAVATAALMLAVACVIGVGVMIDSFRSSLDAWLDTTLTSDIYVNLRDDDSSASTLLGFLDSDSRAVSYSLTRFTSKPGRNGSIVVRAFQPGSRGWGISTVDGDAQSATAALESDSAIAIAEPFALRSGLSPGDQLGLSTNEGEQLFGIAAVYQDYNTGGANVLLSLSLYRRLWGDTAIDGIGIEAADGADVSALAAEISELLSPASVRVTTTTNIKRISLEIFDRTFLITEVLRILAGSVAFLGMVSALMALQLARRREFGILRSLGFAPQDLRRMIVTETGIIGVTAGAIAVPVGILLAALLVFVINVRSFGWTMNFEVAPAALLPGFLLAVTAAILAGVAPALNSYRASVADALRDA